MTRYILGITLVVFVAVLGIALWIHINPSNTISVTTTTGTNSTASNPTSSVASTSSNSNNSNTAQSGYTLADVAKHNSAASCWAAINGNVYDLTKWINQHPGGPEHILAICGTDGSAAFNTQHGGQRQPAQELATFLIGPLVQ